MVLEYSRGSSLLSLAGCALYLTHIILRNGAGYFGAVAASLAAHGTFESLALILLIGGFMLALLRSAMNQETPIVPARPVRARLHPRWADKTTRAGASMGGIRPTPTRIPHRRGHLRPPFRVRAARAV